MSDHSTLERMKAEAGTWSAAELVAGADGLLRCADGALRRRTARWTGDLQQGLLLLDPLERSLASDPVWSVREAATESLGRIVCRNGSSETMTRLSRLLLQRALLDSSDFVRDMCVHQVAQMNCDWQHRFSVLDDTWETGRAYLRCRALKAISRFAEARDPAPHLTSALQDSHWKLRSAGLQELPAHPAILAQLTELVIRRCFDQHKPVARQAQRTVRRIPTLPNDVHQRLASLTPETNSSELLTQLLHQELTEKQTSQFVASCVRRVNWHQRSDRYDEEPASPEQWVQRCLQIAAAGKQPERSIHRETAWLIAALCSALVSDHPSTSA